MTAQSGLGFSGIVAINIPDGGATGTVLTKLTGDNYDYDWQPGGGGASTLQDAYDNAPAPPQITVNAGQPITIDIPAAGNDVFALRASYNTGFRAPTPAQSNATRTQTLGFNGGLVQGGRIPPTNPVAAFYGGMNSNRKNRRAQVPESRSSLWTT